MRSSACSLFLAAMFAAGTAWSTEVTVKNDSLLNNSSGVIEAGFASGEIAASWLTSPCTGNIVAVQILWTSVSPNGSQIVEDSLDIYRSGSFPVPGALAQNIGAPQLTNGVINEYRYLDENNTIPLSVAVTQNETFIVALTFADPPPAVGPSVVRDTDGIQPNRNAIYADISGTFFWLPSSTLGVNGDWVIRAVVDCPVVAQNADVSVLMSALPALYTVGTLTYTITVSNAGPAASPNTTLVDIFPPGYTATSWTCTPSGGAVCTSGASGSGNILVALNLPSAGGATFAVTGNVGAGTTGLLTNSASSVVGSPSSDPNTSNNTATVNTPPLSDRIFANGLEGS